MKAELKHVVSGNSFSLILTPENDTDKEALIKMTSGRYQFQFSGYKYMDPSFQFGAYIPSSSSD